MMKKQGVTRYRVTSEKGIRMDIERYVEALSEEAQIMIEDTASTGSGPASLKGQAVELWRCGQRFFLVADEADARTVVGKGIGSRGEVWTPDETEMVARITDQDARDEVERWKRLTNASCRSFRSGSEGGAA
ncbi:MAG: hypothetical protein ABI972_03430 [Acidobacteriota bacterium]